MQQQPNDRPRPAAGPSRAGGWFTWGPLASSGVLMGVCTSTFPSATGRQAALALGLVGAGWALRSLTPTPRRRPAAPPVDRPTPALPAGSPPRTTPVDPAVDPGVDPARAGEARPALPPAGGAVTFGEPSRRYRPTSGS